MIEIIIPILLLAVSSVINAYGIKSAFSEIRSVRKSISFLGDMLSEERSDTNSRIRRNGEKTNSIESSMRMIANNINDVRMHYVTRSEFRNEMLSFNRQLQNKQIRRIEKYIEQAIRKINKTAKQ